MKCALKGITGRTRSGSLLSYLLIASSPIASRRDGSPTVLTSISCWCWCKLQASSLLNSYLDWLRHTNVKVKIISRSIQYEIQNFVHDILCQHLWCWQFHKRLLHFRFDHFCIIWILGLVPWSSEIDQMSYDIWLSEGIWPGWMMTIIDFRHLKFFSKFYLPFTIEISKIYNGFSLCASIFLTFKVCIVHWN